MRAWAKGIIVALGVFFTSMGVSYAQIKIIPQSTIKEAANPTLVQGSNLVFDHNGTLSFGTIGEESGCWQGEIEWHTTNGKKASITRITSSCNCLEVVWSRRDNTASKSGKIGVKYYPKGHAGKVSQRLFIYTTLSDQNPSAIVKVVGEVTPSADRSGDYAYMMGTLRLRQKSVRVDNKGGVERIAVMNSGSTPLHITHDAKMTLGGLKAYTQPATLQSDEEGDLIIEYAPNGEPPILFLGGIAVPPRERKIEIEIEK